MNNTLDSKIHSWSSDEDGLKYVSLNTFIQFLSNNLFLDYEPCLGPHPDFIYRLNKWLNNVDNDEEQKLLFELISKIFYIGREEFISLHKTAYNTICKNWILELVDFKFDKHDYNKILEDELASCWFCPITDSFRVNQFYHINNITSIQTFRPDWRSLKRFGDVEKIKQYIKSNNIKSIVLLEDFVGTATQSIPVLKFAAELDPEIKVLFIPMIVYPIGYENIKRSLASYSNFSMKPIIKIDNDYLINNTSAPANSFNKIYSDLCKKIYDNIKASLGSKITDKIETFGYKNTGGITVMYTNTPNNSIPILFVESSKWSPLFKRHSRD